MVIEYADSIHGALPLWVRRAVMMERNKTAHKDTQRRSPASRSTTPTTTPAAPSAKPCARCGKLPKMLHRTSGALETVSAVCPDCGYHTLNFGVDSSRPTLAEGRAVNDWNKRQIVRKSRCGL